MTYLTKPFVTFYLLHVVLILSLTSVVLIYQDLSLFHVFILS